MTRDEHRAKCIGAMKYALIRNCGRGDSDCVTAILDSLHGIARVNPIEATPEMIESAMDWTPTPYEIDTEDQEAYAKLVQMILAAGDLTNQPEKKP